MAQPRRAGSIAALGERAPVVLMYHGFSRGRRDDDPENLFVDVDQLELQLSWLLAEGWMPLDLDTYLRARDCGVRPARRSFLVTIDDGYCSVADLAEPVLARLGVPAVLYVPAGLVGATACWLPRPADEPLLDAERLRWLHGLDHMEVGLHGADHRDMRGLRAGDLEDQVLRARDQLAHAIDSPVRSFAYPYGAHDARARAAVAGSGMRAAFSVFDDAGPFAVSRVDVNATDSLRSFRIKVQLPGYRTVWQALDRAPLVRRGVRAWSTRGGQ